MQDLGWLVGSYVHVWATVAVVHGWEAGWWLGTHGALSTARVTGVAGEVGLSLVELRDLCLLAHYVLLLLLLLLQQLMLYVMVLLLEVLRRRQLCLRALRFRRCPHQVHQELRVAVVPSRDHLWPTRALTGKPLVVTDKILQQLLGSCSLRLWSRCVYLLDMLRRWPSQRPVTTICTVL